MTSDNFSIDSLLNDKLVQQKPSGIRKLFDIAATMDNVISLGIGEPDFITPWHIRNAGIHSLEKGKTQYTSNAGLNILRDEVSAYMKRRFNLSYDSKTETLITVGGSEAIDNAMRTFIKPGNGDEVIVPIPSFVCYGPLAELAGGKAVYVQMTEKNDFKLTAEDLRKAITPKTKLLVLPFPNNPTGSILERNELEAIADVLRGTNIVVISDEIYAELYYGEGRHTSIAEIPGMKERTIIVSGFSKTYAMTGWRLGYALGPSSVIKQMTKLHQYAIMCAPTTSQYAAIEAMRNGDDDILMMRSEYNYRRRYIVDSFNKIGLTCFEPKGAFYCFPSIKSTGLSSEEFCNLLLQEEHVAVVPGTAFGDSGEGFIRVSYAYSIDHIKIALERIENFVKRHSKA